MHCGKRALLFTGGGVGLTLLAALVLQALQPHGTPPSSLLMLPIVVAAYFGRLIPGLAATATGAIATSAFLIDPHLPMPWLRPLALLLVGTAMSVTIEALHRSRIQTERERSAAVESNLRFSRLFHSSPVALCLSRLDDGTVTHINAAYTRLFSLSESQVIGRTPQQAGLVFESGSREALFAKMRTRGWIRDEEIEVHTRDGRRVVLVSSQVVESSGVRYSSATFLDITERRRAEIDASESQQRFRDFAENLDEVFFVCSMDGSKVQYMSPAYERVFGRSLARLDRDPIDWTNAVHPDDRKHVLAFLGQRVDKRTDDAFRVVLPDGSVRNLRTTFFPLRGPNGEVDRVAGITSDITKQLELEEQVRQSQKLESLGLLAGGVAHDFNNILAVIGANIGLVGEVVGPEDADLVDEVEKAVTRGASLTRQLLAFSRRQVIEPVVLDVNEVVEDTRKMLRRMVGEDIRLSTSLDPELRHVLMDSGSLVQVLMNLAVNARDAMPTGGALAITTRNHGGEVLLEVADSGCGMSPAVLARIFEPFFTTKGVGNGTGLGLSVVHGIVRQAGGRIEAQSEVGTGTTFSIHFPVSSDVIDRTSFDAILDCHGDEQILLVDDDVFVRGSSARALRSKGYTVLEASDGVEALEVLGDSRAIALLVTDVVMPRMDGRQLANAARARRPSLKVLFTSGYTDDAVLQHGVKQDEVSFLEKPFRTKQLAGRVRRMLDVDPRSKCA